MPGAAGPPCRAALHVLHAPQLQHCWRPYTRHRRAPGLVVCSKADGPGSALAQGAVALLTEGLRAAGVGAQEYQRVAEATSGPARLLPRGDVAGVLRALRRDFERNQYFITGVLTDAIYGEDCVFEDPTVRFQGRDLWKRNLQLLVPFLIEPTIQLKSLQRLPPQPPGQVQKQRQQPAVQPEGSPPGQPRWGLAALLGSLTWAGSESASISMESGPAQLYAEWLLTCYVGLPWRPYVRVNGSTTFTLNEAGNQVVRHVEAWDVSAWGALLLLLRPSERAVWRRAGS